jgi:hypothetical protein
LGIFPFHYPAMNLKSARAPTSSWLALLIVCVFFLNIRVGSAASTALDQWTADYLGRREARGFERRLSFSEALGIQKEFVKRLRPELGRPVGYKVGLVTREAQLKYGVQAPFAWGVAGENVVANNADVAA